MSDHFLREHIFSPAGHIVEGAEAVCSVAVHLTIGVLDIDRCLGALLPFPHLSKRWIATRTDDIRTVSLTVYLTARHGTQAWTYAQQMQQMLRRDGVPVYHVQLTDAQDWTRQIADEHIGMAC
jgi:hypothetical protein